MSTPAGEALVKRGPRIGLVLGGGAARGWAHIGVIRSLERAGIRPDLVCGTSVGALVGSAYAATTLDAFEEWVRTMRRSDVVSLMDLGLSGGLFKGARVLERIGSVLEDRPIEALPMPFGAVATALRTGAEVWLREGSTLAAVRASIALPGLFSPVVRDDIVLVDGGLVNPVPVTLARAMGADIVIAVDLSSDILGRHVVVKTAPAAPAGQVTEWLQKLQALWPSAVAPALPSTPSMPSMLDVIATSLNIMQVRITRSRLAGDPADVIVAPRLAHLGLLDFHRAGEAIDEGARAMSAALESLRVLGLEAQVGSDV